MPELAHGEDEAEIRVIRGLRLALEVSAIVLVLEAAGALLSHSLALTVDAVHNVPDLLAFAVPWTGALFGYAALTGLVRGSSFAGPVDAVYLVLVAVPVLALRAVNLSVLGRIPGRTRDLNLASVVLHLAS